MNDMPKCPECGMTIEVSRMQTPLLDDDLRPIYAVACGCPDCFKMITHHCSAYPFDSNNDPEVRQRYWDLNYSIAIDKWRKAYYMEEEE